MFAEELAQEVVPVRLILIALDVEFGRGSPTLYIDALALRTLLREHGGNHGIPKLELALQTKQALRSRYQTTVQRHVDVPHLQALDDIVFLPFEVQFKFVIKGERSFRIPVDAQLQPVPNFSRDIHLNALAKIEGEGLLITDRDPRILNVLVLPAKANFRHPLWTNFNNIATKNLA